MGKVLPPLLIVSTGGQQQQLRALSPTHDPGQHTGPADCSRTSGQRMDQTKVKGGLQPAPQTLSAPSTVKDKQPQGRAEDRRAERTQSRKATFPSATIRPMFENLIPICCSHPLPDSTKKHHILALLLHLPLVQSALAPCQINIPILWKLDEISSGGVDLSSWPRLPGSLQSQWQPPPLPQCWGPEV